MGKRKTKGMKKRVAPSHRTAGRSVRNSKTLQER